MDYHIVVSRFNEDVSWLREFGSNVRIMNKGDFHTIPVVMQPYSKTLPNIGLDQYSHLRYIVDNYENLPSTVIFTQANLKDHHDIHEPDPNLPMHKFDGSIHNYTNTMTTPQIITDMIKQVYLYGRTQNAKCYVDQKKIFIVDEEYKVNKKYKDECDTGYKFGDWFERYVGKTMPRHDVFLWFKNTIFGSSKAYILSRPKSFYENLLKQFVAVRSEVNHYFERSWFYVLNMDLQIKPNSFISVLGSNIDIFRTLNQIIIDSGQQLIEGSLFFGGGYDMTYNKEFWHKQINLFHLSKNALNILEIGFNAGHSTALILLANPHSTILLFDIMQHAYTRKCLEFLKAAFGAHRFIELVEGDSSITVPQYKIDGEKFDLIHIDGGHSTEAVRADLENCGRFAAHDHVVIIDDTNLKNIRDVIKEYENNNVLIPFSGNNLLLESYLGQMYHYVGRYNISG